MILYVRYSSEFETLSDIWNVYFPFVLCFVTCWITNCDTPFLRSLTFLEFAEGCENVNPLSLLNTNRISPVKFIRAIRTLVKPPFKMVSESKILNVMSWFVSVRNTFISWFLIAECDFASPPKSKKVGINNLEQYPLQWQKRVKTSEKQIRCTIINFHPLKSHSVCEMVEDYTPPKNP